MAALIEIYWAQFKVAMAVELQYRVSAFIWLIGTVLEPVVYLVVWSAVAAAGGGAVGGFQGADFAAYYISLMVVNHLTFTWHMWEYDYRIRQGLLSPLLLKPLHPIHMDIAENLSHKLFTLIVIAPTTVVLIWLFQPVWHTPLWSALLAVPAIVLAFAIQFLFGWAVAMAAFWTTRIAAINRIYFLGKFFLAGQMAPLVLLPLWVQTIATFSPFRWMLSFPVELLVGRLSPLDAWLGLGAQAVWVGLSLLAVKLVWRAGVRRYAAFGA
jgi:ABC-2 type transport system permease protein